MGDSLAQRHSAALQIIQDLKSLLHDVEPPGDISRAQADYDAAEERHSREQNPEKKRALCRELVRYGDHLEEVQEQHKAAQARRKEQLDLFDSRLSKEGYQKLATQASLDTGTDTNPGLENDQATHQTSETLGNLVQTPDLEFIQLSGISNDRATHETTESPGNLPQTTVIPETIEPRSTPSRTHSATPPRGFSTDVDQQVGIEPTGQIARSNKRRDNTSVSRPTKRQRQSVSSDTVAEKTIPFDEVYQGGKARWKYRIVKIDELYYVFGCKKHDKHFCKENPLQAAMSHLKGKGHPNKRSTITQAFRSLGTRVVQCTDEDLELNNKAADRYLAEQEKKKERRKASTKNFAHAPQTGEIYMAWFGDEDKGHWLHAFLVIPFFPRPGDGTDIQSVTESDLRVDIRPCYKLNETTGGYYWAEGYEEHGKNANYREYPIMCLAGEIPHKVDWLPVCHFRKLNLEDEDLDDKDVIKAYIRKTTAGLGNEVEDESEDLYGNSIAGDNDAPTSSRHRQTPIGRTSENVNIDQNIQPRATTDNQESRPLRLNIPTREVKPEHGTQDNIGRGDEATSPVGQPTWIRQMSIQRRWPLARKNAPNMATLSDSE
ncbi:hypothetical protein BFJ66_g7881 [Fusarium oxysporum f. sp. cepae]|uniref:Uncharacterized protein n=1 Tax=Fusarium oxysporum f. sp. cepae TaxID=396571 RepID=A0A3L6NVC8_FUSOX|nr:hypothetical protein BFJ65_g5267 [Fusarium oxysporum f. sp. cepae]RKK44540.1 hypothetical protein BFJ67_g9128 [Fusarium oxysporum f. sp. cepae]RKK47893.1 hypothetical protein BFJ66_g7881 [Fusarium oxysporum f. sp. cepae]